MLQPLLEREFLSNLCLNPSVFAGFAWIPSAALSLVCQRCCREVLLIPVGRAGGERKEMKLCYLLKITNAVKGNAGKIPGWFSGFLLLPPSVTHWRIFGKSLDFLFLWWARAAGGCWEGWTGQKYPQFYPSVCPPLFDANLLFLKSWISSSYSSHPSCLDCELIWIRVVLCHEFVKSLAPLASKCARMLKWTQLSENLRFHAVVKTKILKLFVGVRYLFNFGMINILCFHNKWVSCDLWHVLVEKSLAWELVGWCVCVSYQIYLCFTSSSVTTWKGLLCGYS